MLSLFPLIFWPLSVQFVKYFIVLTCGNVFQMMPGGGNSGVTQFSRLPLAGTDILEEEPLYVNAKQYRRILKRRQDRAKLESLGKIPKERPVRNFCASIRPHYFAMSTQLDCWSCQRLCNICTIFSNPYLWLNIKFWHMKIGTVLNILSHLETFWLNFLFVKIL